MGSTCERTGILCRTLEDAKSNAEHAAKAYVHKKNALRETQILHTQNSDAAQVVDSEESERSAKQALVEAEKIVVTKRIQLLNEMIAHPGSDIQPPVPITALPAPEISVQYTYTLSTEAATYQPQRDRAWRVPIVWLALKPLFSTDTDDAAIDETLRHIIPHLTRFATRDASSSPLRTWIASHLKTASKFTRRTDVANFSELPHAATHHPACRPSQPPTRVLAIYSATCGRSRHIDVVINTLGMDPPEEWHNLEINGYVGDMIRSTVNHMQGPHAFTKLTVVVSDTDKGVTHYMALHPFRSPDICQVTHMITADGGGILRTDANGHLHTPKEFQTHHYHPVNKRLNELELNSVHSMALRYSDDSLDRVEAAKSPDDAKSARISSSHHDILVTSYRVPGSEYEEIRTAISVFTYPLPGIQYKKDCLSTHLIQKVCARVMRARRPPPRDPKNKRQPQGRNQNNRPPGPASGSSNVKPKQHRKREDWELKMPEKDKMLWFYWYSEDAHTKWRIFVIDHSPGREVTEECLNHNAECNRRMNRNFKDAWLEDKSLAENILVNKKPGENGMTPVQYYRHLWRLFIDNDMMALTYDDENAEDDAELPWHLESSKPYLYSSDPGVWKNIGSVSGAGVQHSHRLYETYPEYMELRAEKDKQEYSARTWEGYMELSSAKYEPDHEPCLLLADPYSPIAIPGGARPATADSPPALMAMIKSMQAKIESMEADRIRSIGNKEHLLLLHAHGDFSPFSAAHRGPYS